MPPVSNQSRTIYRSFLDESDQERQVDLTKSPSDPKKVTFNIAENDFSYRESRRSRAPPAPNTILDRKALTKSLDDLNVVFKKRHVDYLYEHLHRQDYPELGTFVEEYKHIFADHPSEVSISSGDSTASPDSKEPHSHRHRLPTALLDFLSDPSNGFVTTTSTVVAIEKSPSGDTTKVVLALHDGLLIETHVMRYREQDGNHASVSVSSQVGCEVGCSFCPIASMGLRGNLTSGEILEQVVHARRIFGEDNQGELYHRHVVQNVTFMGLGEPLQNYDHVVDACRLLANKRVWDLCRGRITISTIGVTPRIYDLTRDLPDVILAVGLYAPNQTLRRAIVPSAQEYPLDALMDALDNHMQDPRDRGLLSPSGRKRRMVMIEYIMMEGKTSSLDCAHELGRLCEDRHLVVNLIPFIIHKDADDRRKCPNPAHIKKFQSIVASYGVLCNVRLNMSVKLSRYIARQLKRERRQSLQDVTLDDIEDLSYWQKLSLIRSRGWKKKAMKVREEKRCIDAGVPCEIASTSCSSPSTPQMNSDSTFENEATLKTLLSYESKDHDTPCHNLRRHWFLPVIISAAVFCRIMLYQRPR